MATNITYRGASAPSAPSSTTYKNAPLTNAEVDGNILSLQTAVDSAIASLSGKQATLVSGTNIKTVAGATVLGSGDIPFKTINASSIQGSGDLSLQPTLVSGTNIRTVAGQSLLGTSDISFKTINSTSVQGSGDIAVQPTLVSGTNIKTINGASLLGASNIVLPTLTGTETLSGKTITGLFETRVAMAANNIDVSLGNVFTKTISGATTLTVSNVPATGTVVGFILDLTNGGSAVITWWAAIKWANGAAPTLTAAGRDMVGFITHDGGTTWNGYMIAKGLA